jgi:hypothetical protein
MTNLPDPAAPAEAARRHAIALVRARLDEIVEQTGRTETDAAIPAITRMPGGCSRRVDDYPGTAPRSSTCAG